MSFLNFIVNIFFSVDCGANEVISGSRDSKADMCHFNRSTLLKGGGATAPILLAICSKCSYCVVDTV